jgi:hypothetical protein
MREMMLKKEFFITACSIFILLLIQVPFTYAQLTAETGSNGDITVKGIRDSAIAWGLNGVNYQVGATAAERFPDQGFVEVNIVADASGTFGSGSGYKMLVQFWNDEQNYVAFGIINDPGAAPWGGLTLMVEGAAYGKPIGGYWPQNYEGFDSDIVYHHFYVRWTATTITFVIDHLTDHTMIYNINMSNPSFSCLGAARLPGDSVHGTFQLLDFSSHLFNQPVFTLITWDPQFTIINNTTTDDGDTDTDTDDGDTATDTDDSDTDTEADGDTDTDTDDSDTESEDTD